ncbi:MAG TPA: hypothetical protein VF884_07250 [Nitrososphaeraceae archaeon]
MIKDVMQLWTDETFTDFAIRFNDLGFVATSNSNALFTKIIDESDCTDSHCYDWGHTLTEWVNFYLCNLSNYLEREVGSGFNNKGFSDSRSFTTGGLTSITRSGLKLTSSTADFVKCKYCNLRYALFEECQDHEAFWHTLEISNDWNRHQLTTESPSGKCIK